MTDLTLIAREPGVGHIWDRTATFVTAALDHTTTAPR